MLILDLETEEEVPVSVGQNTAMTLEDLTTALTLEDGATALTLEDA